MNKLITLGRYGKSGKNRRPQIVSQRVSRCGPCPAIAQNGTVMPLSKVSRRANFKKPEVWPFHKIEY